MPAVPPLSAPAAPAPASEPFRPGHERVRRLLMAVGHLSPTPPGVFTAIVSPGTVQRLFSNLDERWPPLMTYAQTADLVQVSVSTLKGWFSQGRFATCVKRGKPARVIRDLFVQEFLRDEFGINAK